jgi:lysophospholipase L1-like esterase
VRKFILILPVLALFLAACADKGPYTLKFTAPGMDGKFEADDPHMQYYGRWDFSNPKAPASDWGAVYIKAVFEGPQVSVAIDDDGNDYQYSIDSGDFKIIESNGNHDYLLETGLNDSSHELLLVKRTSCTYGRGIFKGINLKPGKNLVTPAPAPSRRLEFIGDSLSCGFENEAVTVVKYGDRTTENGFMAFGPVAARLCSAQWRVMAKKAIGVACNLFENQTGTQPKIRDYYSRTLSDEADNTWNFASWQPDAVIIAAGAVDYLGLHEYPSQQIFEPAYKELISYVREKNPGAAIICVAYFPGESAAYIRDAVNDMIPADPKLFLVDGQLPSPWVDEAVDFIPEGTHLNIAGHAKMGEKLSEAIKIIMGW